MNSMRDISGCSIELPPKPGAKGKGKGKKQSVPSLTVRGPPLAVPHVAAAVDCLLDRVRVEVVLSELIMELENCGACAEREAATQAKHPIEVLARALPVQPPAYTLGVFQKAALNLDAVGVPTSAALSGVSALDAGEDQINASVLAALLLAFGNARTEVKAVVGQPAGFQKLFITRLEVAPQAVLSSFRLPAELLEQDINMLRGELSRFCDRCMPEGGEPRFVASCSARRTLKLVLTKARRDTCGVGIAGGAVSTPASPFQLFTRGVGQMFGESNGMKRLSDQADLGVSHQFRA